MTVTSEQPQVRPRAGWFVVPVVLWVIAAVLFGLALAALSHIINSGIDPVRNQATLTVPADGLTLYTTDPVSTATCNLTGDNGRAVELDSFSFNLDINVNGPTYHGIGVTPDNLAAGSYRLACTDLASDSRLGTGPRVDVTAIATRALWGFVLPPVLGIAGLVVLTVLLIKRHSAKSRIRSQQAYAGAAGYGSAWNQQNGPGRSDSDAPPPPPPPPAG
jgi:hypothetical protein